MKQETSRGEARDADCQEMMLKVNIMVQLPEMVDSCWVPLEEVAEMLALMPD
jgi:hypothetical protein